MADDSAILINQDTDTKGIKQCDFVIETDDVLTAEAVDSRCQTAKSVSENLAEVPVVIYERQKNRKTEQADGIPKPSQDFLTSSMSLSTLYDEIVAKAKVDHSSKEIQDIFSAVEEMLKRLVSGEIKIRYDYMGYITTLKFRGADLQQCGSMHEKTSLWKSSRRQGRENKFLECDYVVILHNEDNVVRIESGNCQGCRRVVPGDMYGHARQFNPCFLSALYSLIDSKCSCHVDPDHTLSECTVARDTGRLQIAKIPGFCLRNVKESEHCSLVFFWTSHTKSLLAPNIETLQTTERIERLVIRVDILPGFEYPGDKDGDECGKKRFIIAKACPYNCIQDFMVSYCMHELRALKHVSDQHKQCFIIIKFLYGQFIYWTGLDKFTNSYHAKVAFLTHCQTCTDEQKDCTTCITEILQSLVEAYRSGSLRLPEFHPVESCLKLHQGELFQIPISSLLHVLSQLKSPNENHKCNSQYRPCHTVGLIKRTCRMLFEQGRTDLNDFYGRPFENTVSTEDILAVLMSDRSLFFLVVCEPDNRYVTEMLCHRLHCPKPERVLLWWRAKCMAKMILASDITHIRDETIKKLVEDVQKNAILRSYERPLFLTSSQSVTEMPKNDSETSSLTPSLDGRCNDTTGLSVPTDSIFTDDLQLNWSALNVTEQQIEKFRRLAEEKRKEKRERSFPPPITPPGLSTEIPMHQPIVPGLFSDGMPEIQFEEVRPALNAPFHGLLTSSTVRSFSQNKHNNYPPSGTLMNIPAVPTTGIVTGGQTMEFNPYIPFQEYHLPIDSQQPPMLPSRIPQGSMVPGLPGIPCQGMPEVPGGFPRMMSTGVRPPVQELLLEVRQGVGARIPCLPISSTTRSFQRNVKNNTQPPESFLDNQAAYRPGFVPQERLMEFNPNIPPPGYHLPFGSLQRPMIPCMMPPGIQMQQPRIQSIPVTSLEWMPVMPGESSQMMNSGVMLPIQVPFTVVGQGVGARIPCWPISSTTRSFQRNVKNNTQLPGSFLDNQAAYRPGFVPQERIIDFNPNIPPPGYHPPFGSLQPPAIPCMMPPGIQMQQPMIQSIPVTSSDDDLRCDAANPSTVYSSWTNK